MRDDRHGGRDDRAAQGWNPQLKAAHREVRPTEPH